MAADIGVLKTINLTRDF